jgi:glycosyltransferase involved in cell wall biosynthesis
MAVNLFLSSHVWLGARSPNGPKHHFRLLYEEVFRGHAIAVFPKRPDSWLLLGAVRNVPAVLQGDLNVLGPGYPVISGALASLVKRDPRIIVHTWKVPGATDHHLTAHAYDAALRRAMGLAKAVVVASLVQKRQIEAIGVSCPVLFAPVTVDSVFWHPDPHDRQNVLNRFDLRERGYILTVGGTDRNERYAAVVAKSLGLTYVRSTYDIEIAELARNELSRSDLAENIRVLVNPSDTEVRALYAGAFLVCLPTRTRTNPAGLSALVEAMACGTVAAVPEDLAEGYFSDGISGLTLGGTADEFSMRVLAIRDRFPVIAKRAREVAETALHQRTVGERIRSEMWTAGVIQN